MLKGSSFFPADVILLCFAWFRMPFIAAIYSWSSSSHPPPPLPHSLTFFRSFYRFTSLLFLLITYSSEVISIYRSHITIHQMATASSIHLQRSLCVKDSAQDGLQFIIGYHFKLYWTLLAYFADNNPWRTWCTPNAFCLRRSARWNTALP